MAQTHGIRMFDRVKLTLAGVLGACLAVWPLSEFRFSIGSFSVSPAIVILVVLVASELCCAKYTTPRRMSMFLLTSVYLFYGVVAASLIMAPNADVAISEIVKLSVSLTTYLSVVLVFSHSGAMAERTWERAIFVGGIVCIVLMYVYLILFRAGYIGVNISYPTKEHKNTLGLYLAALLPVALAWSQSSKKMRPAVYFVLILATTVLTLSRGAWVSGAAGCFVVAVLFARNIRWSTVLRNTTILVVGIVVVVSVLPIDTTVIARRYASLISLSDSDGETSISARQQLIAQGLEAFSVSPIWGHGLASYETKYGNGRASHNDFVRILTEQGLLGFSAFFILLGSHVVAGVRAARRGSGWVEVGLTGSVVGMSIYFLFINDYLGILLWITLGFLHAACIRMRNRPSQVGHRADQP